MTLKDCYSIACTIEQSKQFPKMCGFRQKFRHSPCSDCMPAWHDSRCIFSALPCCSCAASPSPASLACLCTALCSLSLSLSLPLSCLPLFVPPPSISLSFPVSRLHVCPAFSSCPHSHAWAHRITVGISEVLTRLSHRWTRWPSSGASCVVGCFACSNVTRFLQGLVFECGSGRCWRSAAAGTHPGWSPPERRHKGSCHFACERDSFR
jgi:hypothetical protein